MSSTSHLTSLVFLLSTTARLALTAPSLTDDSKCGCYLTNGSDVSFFSSHRFYDFRSLQQYQGAPDPVTDKNAVSTAPESSSYFASDTWTSMWETQVWNNSNHARKDAKVLMINSKSNIYIEPNTDHSAPSKTWLTLRTQKLSEFQTAAEFASANQSFLFLSIRMLARTIGDSGGCTAMFTYRDAKELAAVQEADLEVLTKDPSNAVQYTNQPSYTKDGDSIDAATQNATLPIEWSDWAVHRLDWTPRQSTWYANGQKVANISFQTPRDPSNIIFNAWSDGGNWTGNMTLNNSAYLQIQWIELVYNSTKVEKRDQDHVGALPRLGHVMGRDSTSGGCTKVCSIDDTPTIGQPVLLWGSGAVRSLGGTGLAAWIPSLVAIILLFSSPSLFQ